MRINQLAKIMAMFRKRYGVVVDAAREKHLEKYYKNLITAKQVFPLFNESKILVGLCEVWKVKENDVELIKNKVPPKEIYLGNVLFVANVTLDPHFTKLGLYSFYRNFLKQVYRNKETKVDKVFWYSFKRKRITRIFRRPEWLS